MSVPQKTIFAVVAGILIIISASILIAIQLNFIVEDVLSQPIYFQFFAFLTSLSVAVIALIGGIMSIARRMFVFALIGTSFILLDSFNGFAPYGIVEIFRGSLLIYPYTLFFAGYIAAFIFSLLGIVLLAKSRNEFL